MTGEVPQRATSRPLRRWAAAGALVLFGLIVAFAALEIFARILFSDGTNFDVEMWRYAKELKRVSDIPGVGHEHIPNSAGNFERVDLKINAHKLRDYDYDFPKPEGVTRILMLGNSVTLGWGAPFDDVTSKRLEKLLNANGSGRRYEVINTGIGNYNSAMEVAYFLGEGYKYQPDIVVLNFAVNDGEPTPIRKRSLIFENSYAAVVAAGAWETVSRLYGDRPDWKSYYLGLYADGAAGWKVNEKAIGQLIDYCQSHKIDLLIASYPELHQIPGYPLQFVTTKIGGVAAAHSVPFVDLLPAVADVTDSKSLWVTDTDAHPNGIAAGRFATLLEKTLRTTFPDKF